jgi:hypothetical protein
MERPTVKLVFCFCFCYGKGSFDNQQTAKCGDPFDNESL